MPRVEKQARTRSYTRPYLEGLKRGTLQALAKKEGVKANGKSSEIIMQLLHASRLVVMSGTSSPTEQHLMGRPEDASLLTDGTAASSSSLQGSNSTPETQLLHEHFDENHSENTPPTLVPSRGNSEDIHTPIIDDLTDSEVRDVRRRLTRWNNERISVREDIQDAWELFQYADGSVDGDMDGIRKSIWTRMSVEWRVVRRLRWHRHLYDGTGHMPVRQRRKWNAFIRDNWNQEKIAMRREDEERQKRHAEGIFSESDSEDEPMDCTPLSDDSTVGDGNERC